jgi:hypothetical protein
VTPHHLNCETVFRYLAPQTGNTFIGIPGEGDPDNPNGGPSFADGYVCLFDPETRKLLTWVEFEHFDKAAKALRPAPPRPSHARPRQRLSGLAGASV